MLKIVSAALVAGSLIAAPAMAATVMKTETAPVTKSQTLKPSVANANAKAKVTAKKVKHHKAHKKTSAVVSKKHISSTAPVKHIVAKKKV
ncbi:MAG: His-rich protein BRANT [Afipia sp.]